MYTKKILHYGKEDADGVTIAVPWHILSKPSSEFARTSRELWKGADVNWRTAMSYDATLALIEALRINPTRKGVAEALRSSNFKVDGASGSIKFESGDRQKYPQLVKIVANKESRSGLGYDFVPVEPLIVKLKSLEGFVRLRKDSNINASIIKKIENNTSVTILNFKVGKTEGCDKEWYKVQLQNQEGWMCSDYFQ